MTSLLIFNFATGLYLWTHWHLGRHWSPRMSIRLDHQVITTGPYRWVRHPLYALNFLLFLGAFGMTANWLVGAVGIVSSSLIAGRAGEEEAMLLEHFGEPYASYMKRTGRFLPRFWG